MDEETARALLEKAADADAPRSRVDISLARKMGRRRLRWRRAGAAGGPALAAVAVIALVASGLGPAGRAGRFAGPNRPTPAVAASRVSPPKRFSPLISYASFGWLPSGVRPDSGQIASTNEYLTAGRDAAWSLTVYVAGRCQPSYATLLAAVRHHEQPSINCTESSSSGWQAAVVGLAGRISGRRAFWTLKDASLVWQYARGSWADLSVPRGTAAHRAAVAIARHVRFGTVPAARVLFPAQLTRLPRNWRVDYTYFKVDAGVLRASEYTLSGDRTVDAPMFTTNPATANGSCYFYSHGQSVREIINGYRVTVSHFPAARGALATQQVCAAHADGLFVFVSTYGSHPPLDAVAIFRDHLRLLGTDPAHWTTRPVT
jgi:hypothetical protein